MVFVCMHAVPLHLFRMLDKMRGVSLTDISSTVLVVLSETTLKGRVWVSSLPPSLPLPLD